MAMRLSGLMSGMDTESIIQQLVEARKSKVDVKKKAQISLNYKQEAWKSLNTKLRNLQQKYISNMRFSDAYSKKTTKVSNPNAVSVITGDNAVNGVQSLEIRQLAKTGYLTGAQLGEGKKNYTALSTMEDLGVTFDEAGKGSFSVKAGNSTVDIEVTKDTTISDVLSKIKSAGLNASFDAKNQRFFVSAKDSGAGNDFSITASDSNGMAALKALGLQVNLKEDDATKKQYEAYAAYAKDTASDADIRTNMSSMIQDTVDKRVAAYQKKYTSLMETKAAAEKKIAEIQEKYQDSPLDTAENYAGSIEEKEETIKNLEEFLKGNIYTSEEEKQQAEEQLAALKDEVKDLTAKKADAEAVEAQQSVIDKADKDMAAIVGENGNDGYVTISKSEVDGKTVYTATAAQKLEDEVADSYVTKAKYAAEALADAANSKDTGATKVSGQDAIIKLNGAEFKNTTNVFEINGLTFTALSETKEGEAVTITTQDDTDGIYDMIKNFLKEYNSIINEMDKLYNADSTNLKPLTSEEKAELSDREVEEWETKIKDSILRRDESINSVSSALKSIMSGGIEVNGKKMYLFDFGIDTAGYFNSADNEKNAYHIDGDPDDETSSGNADKLKSMISSDPDTVIAFFTKLSQSLYGKMTDLSRSVDGYRSFGSFYDDKKMKSDYDDYSSKITEMEAKLNEYEDKWYAKFAKMETALAKMQSKTNALSGLLGG
ncbi:MAG: flagellar filament capping protein FliD [Roseburia sp.]|nr:flagellar filament capping protein FliD [Roseburia sp.]